VFSCKNLYATKIDRERGIDFAIFRLDRAVTDRPPLPIQRENLVSNKDPVSIVGYPDGLPLKVSRGTVTAANSTKSYFGTNLASFIGSSGSPVFLKDQEVVQGVLVRGDKDYRPNGACFVVNRCDNDSNCVGSEVLTTNTFAKLIPEIGPAFEILQISVAETTGTVEGTADPGETLDLRLFIRGKGTMPIPSGKIAISPRESSTQILQGSATFAGVSADGITSVDGFRIKLPATLPCVPAIEFDVTISTDDGKQLKSVATLPLGHEEDEVFSLLEDEATIPDNMPDGLVVSRTIDHIPAGRPVQFSIIADHPDVTQLSFYVSGPNGKTAQLFNHGISPDGLLASANRPRISGVFGRDLKPYDSLAEFSDVSTPGLWKIRVIDDVPGAKGKLTYAGIAFIKRVCKTVTVPQ
ncbi:MAG: serine protease, partial [Verrucomicrobiota bacterium]